MEYSVYDLLRILLKKWYIIALCACLLGGGAVFLSRYSYKTAVEQYKELTTETVPVIVDVGTTKVSFRYTFTANTDKLTSLFNLYLESLKNGDTETGIFVKNEDLKKLFIRESTPQVEAEMISGEIMEKLQEAADEANLQEPPSVAPDKTVIPPTGALNVAAHFVAKIDGYQKLSLEVSGLEQVVAEQLIAAYCALITEECCTDLLSVTLKETGKKFVLDPLRPTATAVLAQTVMREPPAPPSMVKTAGTAALFGAVLGCFGVLIATFIKDTRPQKTKPQADKE